MNDKLRGGLRLLVILLGLAILVYPSLSEYLSEKNSSRATAVFDESVLLLEQERLDALLEEAREYNRLLVADAGFEKPRVDEYGVPVSLENYWELLNVSGTDMMGYITIPSIHVTIPIYHGTDERVLQVGAGHVQNTSLPVGGESTHAALSGHRGLPTRALFTDLDLVKEGDVFYIKVLDQTLCYMVDQILTVYPDETQHLAIVPGEDYVTLITCTPYGVNSHRLLVRGTRVPYEPEEEGVIPVVQEEELPLWRRMPMQYRHLLIGLGVLAGCVVLKFLLSWTIKQIKKKRG